MPMMTLIDRPWKKVELRHDIYHDHEVCFACKGSGFGRSHTIGNVWIDGFQYTRLWSCEVCSGRGYLKKTGAYRS